jgi:hypothetical protein
MAQPRETISSYLRRPGAPFRLYYKGKSGQTKSLSGQYQWEDIKAVKDWDAFNQSPVRAKFRHLLYEDQHKSLLQPCIPIANTIILSELYLQTSLHMGLLAKVNLALEAITKISEEKEEDEHEYGRVMNLGVLPGPRSLNFIPDLVAQDISEVGWGEERFDEDEDEDEAGEEQEDEGEEEIHGSDFDQRSTKEGNNSDFGKHENPANRELTSNEERTNTSGPEEVGSSQTEERLETSSSSPSHQPTNLSLLQAVKPPILLVGDIKLHSGWKHSMWKHVDSRGADFRQVLSQVNFYMTQNACQYGFVVTEREFVAVYRPGRKGLLKVSGSFPIRTRTEGLGQEEREGTYPSSSPGDLCADEALLALILWAADPPSPGTDPADETCDAEAEEDEYYPTIKAVAFSSDGPTSAEKGSVFS